MIRNLITLAGLAVLLSCTTVSEQEQTRVVDETPAATFEREPVAVPEPIEDESVALFTREPPAEADDAAADEKTSSIRKGTGMFVREAADFKGQDYLYALSLYSDSQPYGAADLPDHEAFASYRAYVLPFQKGGKTMYRLRLGFFKGYTAANEVRQQLTQYFPDAWIVEVSRSEYDKSVKASISEPVVAMEDLTAPAGDITLKFEAADLREFVRVVFEDILKQSYMIDPLVKGRVTLHTSAPVADDAIIPILESVLQQNGAAAVFQEGIYKVVPIADAQGQVGSHSVGNRPPGENFGFAVQIVPLKYVSAAEIEKIITPLVPKGATIRIIEQRNLLVLSGPRYRINQLLGTINSFDVDWLKGMSFGLFRLQYAEAGMLVSELENVIGTGGQSPLAGIVRLTPIERLNAVLVITHAPHYMDQVADMIDQFDWGTEGPPGRRLYVYHLKNAKADNLASALQQIYGLGDGAEPAAPSAKISQLPPGEGGNVFQTAEALSAMPPALLAATGAGGDYPIDIPLTGPGAGRAPPAPAPKPSPAAASGGAEGVQAELMTQTPISIIADQDSNALLIMASPRDYRGIEAVIKQLDLAPRQVLIEATIAEVTLSDALDFGVRWFLADGTWSAGLDTPVPTVAGGDGFTFATFSNSRDARIFIDMLASKTSVKFLSAPQVMVLDNNTANIRVGDQIPVTVRTSQSTTTGGASTAPIVSEVQFRDTGTLLSVTPRINAGGQVTLEISQEVSLPGSEPAVGGGGNVAISQRTIDSSVVVQSGSTVLLGGLILETENESRAGIPFLMDIPWLGNLFSTSSKDVFRTELIVLITPQVIEDEGEAQAVLEEMRNKMEKVIEYGKSVKSVDL